MVHTSGAHKWCTQDRGTRQRGALYTLLPWPYLRGVTLWSRQGRIPVTLSLALKSFSKKDSNIEWTWSESTPCSAPLGCHGGHPHGCRGTVHPHRTRAAGHPRFVTTTPQSASSNKSTNNTQQHHSSDNQGLRVCPHFLCVCHCALRYL